MITQEKIAKFVDRWAWTTAVVLSAFLAARLTQPWIFIITGYSLWQAGYRAAEESYEGGLITCDECGTSLWQAGYRAALKDQRDREEL